MKSSKLRNFTAAMAKLLQIVAWAGSGLLILSIIPFYMFRGQLTADSLNVDISSFASPNFDITKVSEKNMFLVFLIWLLTMIITMVLLGLICRNINLIFKKTNSESPFAKSNVQLIKQIGYIAISLPIVKCVANLILGFFSKNLTLGIELSEFLFGLVILCLAQYFAYGASLEEDVNGLL